MYTLPATIVPKCSVATSAIDNWIPSLFSMLSWSVAKQFQTYDEALHPYLHLFPFPQVCAMWYTKLSVVSKLWGTKDWYTLSIGISGITSCDIVIPIHSSNHLCTTPLWFYTQIGWHRRSSMNVFSRYLSWTYSRW